MFHEQPHAKVPCRRMAELKTRVLVVDDDQRLRDLLVRYLGEQGFEVQRGARRRRDGQAAGARALRPGGARPDAAGRGRPRDLPPAARRRAPAPAIIMLTAKGDDVDRIVGLEMGADDYLPKPFNPRELVARINAVLRRRQPAGPAGRARRRQRAPRFGAFELNLATRTLTRDGKPVALTTGEFSVLKVLVQHPRQPLSRDKLMELARGREYERVRPLDRRADLAPAQDRRGRPRAPAPHPDRVGLRLRVRARRQPPA